MGEKVESERQCDIAATTKSLRIAIAAAHEVVHSQYPPLTDEDIENLVRPPTPDDNWTPADLAASVADWDADPMKPYLVNVGGNNNLAPLWRYTTRFFNKFPEEIIGEDNDLEYDASGNTTVEINGQSVYKPNWSASFAKPLLTILTHDIWQDSPDAAAICLQYVIKCRNNDQRQMAWPKTNPTTDRFFTWFKVARSTSGTGSTTMPEIHQQAVAHNRKRSIWSKLFLEIEAIAFRPDHPPLRSAPLTGNDVGTYTVGRQHLALLLQALDAIKDRHGLPLYRKAEFTQKAAEAAMKSKDKPTQKHFPVVREQALLAMRQRKAKAAKVAAAAAAAPTPAPASPAASVIPAFRAAPPEDRPTITGGVKDDGEVPQSINLDEPTSELPGRSAHEVCAELADLNI